MASNKPSAAVVSVCAGPPSAWSFGSVGISQGPPTLGQKPVNPLPSPSLSLSLSLALSAQPLISLQDFFAGTIAGSCQIAVGHPFGE